MAVLNSVPGLEVTIKVNGEIAAEYDDPNLADSPPEKTVTKYIECIDNAEFSVYSQTHDTYAWGYKNHYLLTRLYIDSQYVAGLYIEPKLENKVAHITGVDEKKCSETNWIKRKFTFSPVKIVEEVQAKKKSSERPSSKSFGIIEVRVTREIKGIPRPKSSSVAVKDFVNKKLDTTEKSVKGRSVSHGTTFLKTEQIVKPRFLTTGPLPEDNGPIAKFRFIHRSKDALKQEMIIPRSPSPDPLLSLSVDEIHRLARERLNVPVKTEVSVKREHETLDLTIEDENVSARKKARYESPIDLTDD